MDNTNRDFYEVNSRGDEPQIDKSARFGERIQVRKSLFPGVRKKGMQVTHILISINVIIWLLIKVYSIYSGIPEGKLLTVFGAKDNALIMSGEYWRFLTPIFLHNGIIHLFLNSYSLYILGNMVERLIGKHRFLFIYIFSGIMGSIMSFMFSPNPAVGASGAIFGLMAVLVYHLIERRVIFRAQLGKTIMMTIAINLFYGFTVARIDNFGHIGGLIGGFFLAGAVGNKNLPRKKVSRIIFTILTMFITVGFLFYGFTSQQNRQLKDINKMEILVEQQKWAEAENIGREIVESETKNNTILSSVLWYLSIAEINQGKSMEAIEHARILSDVDPSNGYYLLGRMYAHVGEVELAKKQLTKAMQINPELRSEIQNLLDMLENIY